MIFKYSSAQNVFMYESNTEKETKKVFLFKINSSLKKANKFLYSKFLLNKIRKEDDIILL